MRSLGLLLGLWGGVVFAQTGNAKVAPFPLQLRQGPPEFTPAALTELRAEFLKVLRENGIPSPSTFEINLAIEKAQRQDCDLEDQCLSALAMRSTSLYAMFVLVEWNLKDSVTVSGRVVRQDGQLTVPKKSVTRSYTKKEGFGAAARLALKQLVLEELKLQSLPTARATAVVVEPPPVDAGVPVPAKVVADAGVELPPPPPPPVVDQGPPARKIIGYGAAGAGGVAAVAGLALFLGGRSDAQAQLDERGRLTPMGDRTKLEAASGQQGIGVGLMCGGVVVAAVGTILVLLPGDEPKPMTWWVAPTPGGAAVGIQGVLP